MPDAPPAPAPEPEPAAPAEARLLARPGLAAFLGSRLASSLASQTQSVAIAWQVYAITGDPLSLGLVGLAQFVPVAALVFVAGQVVDRFDRRRIALLCQLVESATSLVLAVFAWRGAVTPGVVYALVAVIGAARAFEGPSLQALLPGLVGRALFPRAAATSSSLFQATVILGPSVGGLLYGVGPAIAYASAAVLFAAAAASMATIRRVAAPEAGRGRVTLATVFGGIAFLRSRPEILGAISLDLFAVLLGGATALLPVYARDILRAGPVGLGMLKAAPAVGALLTSLVLARRPPARRAGALMFAAVAVFGVGTIGFGLSRTVWVSVAALALLGAADVVSVVIRSTLIQLRTPDDMRGRVAAVNLLFIGSSNQLGEFESGVLASLVGAVPAVVLGGVGTLAVVGLWMGLFPQLRRLDRLD